MTMNLKEELKSIGMADSEAKIYLTLLEHGSLSASDIAKLTGIARTNCYHLLRDLEEKHLIENKKITRRTVFTPKNPRAILDFVSKRKDAADRIIPDLQGLLGAQKNKPQIRFFEGWDEVKTIYEQTLEAEKIIAIGSTEKLSNLELKFFSWYTNELAKRKIIFNDILTHASKAHSAEEIKRVRGALHQIKFLPERFKDTPTDILIWNNHIALIVLEEPIFGTILTSQVFVQTFKTIFEILWDRI